MNIISKVKDITSKKLKEIESDEDRINYEVNLTHGSGIHKYSKFQKEYNFNVKALKEDNNYDNQSIVIKSVSSQGNDEGNLKNFKRGLASIFKKSKADGGLFKEDKMANAANFNNEKIDETANTFRKLLK